jgi:hypothetical protein
VTLLRRDDTRDAQISEQHVLITRRPRVACRRGLDGAGAGLPLGSHFDLLNFVEIDLPFSVREVLCTHTTLNPRLVYRVMYLYFIKRRAVSN